MMFLGQVDEARLARPAPALARCLKSGYRARSWGPTPGITTPVRRAHRAFIGLSAAQPDGVLVGLGTIMLMKLLKPGEGGHRGCVEGGARTGG